MSVSGWDTYFGELTSFLRQSERQEGVANERFAEYATERLEVCYRTLSQLENNLRESRSILAQNLQSMISQLKRLILGSHQDRVAYRDRIANPDTMDTSYTLSTVTHSRQSGRPRFDISADQIQYLRSLSFSWTQISHLLGISRSTLYRRRIDSELDIDDELSQPVDDQQLRDAILQIRSAQPFIGEVILIGQLRAMGLYATRARVREIIASVDPLNTAMRWRSGLTPRRPYSVPGPNSLWHIGECFLHACNYTVMQLQ